MTSSSDPVTGNTPQVALWRMPDFEQPRAEPPPPTPTPAEPENAAEAPAPPAEEELAELRKQAREGGYREGYESGYAEGRRCAGEELNANMDHLSSIIDQLAAPLQVLDESLERDLAALVTTISRHLIYRELSLNEGQIVAVVREAAGLLPIAERQVTLYLNPEDAVLVREALALDVDERPWSIVDDPLLTRGGCRVVSGPSQIDATVESRINRLISRLLGDRRRDEDGASHDAED